MTMGSLPTAKVPLQSRTENPTRIVSDEYRPLTFEDKVLVAYGYHVLHIQQQHLATLFRQNSGRIAEACKAVREALT